MNKNIMAGLAGLLVLVLTGCKSEVLEYKDVEVVNGKIFKKGADKPFSGIFSANAGEIVDGRQTGFAQFAQKAESNALSTSEVFVGGCGHGNANPSAWEFGLKLAAGGLCKASVRDGLFDGKASCQTEKSERPTLEMSFKEGLLDGPLTYFKSRTGGSFITTVTFKKGQPDGKQEMINTATQKLVYRTNWKNGLMDGEEEAFDFNTGNLIGHVKCVNNDPEGEVVRYAPNGKTLVYKATFVAGELHGTEESFSATTGKLTHRTEWNHGAMQGIERDWNEQGELTFETDHGGKDVSSSSNPAAPALTPEQLNACVDIWTAAYQKENGQDAMVTMDQLGEWEGWCKEGKRP